MGGSISTNEAHASIRTTARRTAKTSRKALYMNLARDYVSRKHVNPVNG
jgi:hypothetical protein